MNTQILSEDILALYMSNTITRDLMLEFYTAMVEWEAKVMYDSKIV